MRSLYIKRYINSPSFYFTFTRICNDILSGTSSTLSNYECVQNKLDINGVSFKLLWSTAIFSNTEWTERVYLCMFVQRANTNPNSMLEIITINWICMFVQWSKTNHNSVLQIKQLSSIPPPLSYDMMIIRLLTRFVYFIGKILFCLRLESAYLLNGNIRCLSFINACCLFGRRGNLDK